MTYAQNLVCYDSDSHIMETLDWLESGATAAEAKLLGTILNAKNAGARKLSEVIGQAQARRADPEATRQLLETPIISGPKGWAAYGASTPDERSKALDMLGFKAQLVFPTFSLGQFVRSDDNDVVYAGARALARAMGSFCADDKRLLGVGFLPLQDPERAIEVIDVGVKEGLAAFWIKSDPSCGMSPSHVDFYPIWEKLLDHGLPVMLHIGGGSLAPKAYANNGHPRPTDWLGGGENLRGRDYVVVSHSVQNCLTALVLDGVLHRYPELRCGVIELGGTWVPSFLRTLDQAARSFHKSEPLIAALDRPPSDYIRRQVRFSLFPHEDAGWLVQQAGDELFMFASDYPHPEGSKDPIRHFQKSLDAAQTPATSVDRFYRENFIALMGL